MNKAAGEATQKLHQAVQKLLDEIANVKIASDNVRLEKMIFVNGQ